MLRGMVTVSFRSQSNLIFFHNAAIVFAHDPNCLQQSECLVVDSKFGQGSGADD